MPSRAPRRAGRHASRGVDAASPQPRPWLPPRASRPCPRPSRVAPAFPAFALAPLGLRHRLLSSGYRLARAAARARVGARALPADGQIAPVTETAVAPDLLEALDVERDLAAKVTLHREAAIDDLADLRDLRLGQVAHARRAIDACLLEHLARGGRADAEDVAKRHVDALLARDIDASDSSHL